MFLKTTYANATQFEFNGGEKWVWKIHYTIQTHYANRNVYTQLNQQTNNFQTYPTQYKPKYIDNIKRLNSLRVCIHYMAYIVRQLYPLLYLYLVYYILINTTVCFHLSSAFGSVWELRSLVVTCLWERECCGKYEKIHINPLKKTGEMARKVTENVL